MNIKTVNEYYFYYCKHFNKRYSVPKILSDYESYRCSTVQCYRQCLKCASTVLSVVKVAWAYGYIHKHVCCTNQA